MMVWSQACFYIFLHYVAYGQKSVSSMLACLQAIALVGSGAGEPGNISVHDFYLAFE
jgi:hypothetical protein